MTAAKLQLAQAAMGQPGTNVGELCVGIHLNFAISTRSEQAGLDHLGIQVETQDELQEVYGRLQQADRPVLEEGVTTCCYAKSEKAWIKTRKVCHGKPFSPLAKAPSTGITSISIPSAKHRERVARLRPIPRLPLPPVAPQNERRRHD